MTAFHYRAELKGCDDETAVYGFTPYDMMPGVTFGEFRLDLRKWTVEVTIAPQQNGEPLGYSANCVPALVHKIKKAYQQSRELPNEVLFIA